MSSRILKAYRIMIFTGIILLPTVVPHAVQDLQDLKTVIDSASATINAAPNDSSWGFLNPASPSGALGTADLVSNITTTVLRATYLLNVNRTAWTTIPPNNTAPVTSTSPSPDTPPFPSGTAPPRSNTSLDQPYIDYISSIPTFAAALTHLGRAWHKELNKPVWDAIAALQQTLSTFSSALLQEELIHSTSVVRTIRASSALEDAQGAWSRLLNIPGAAAVRKRRDDVHGRAAERLLPENGVAYTHKELWGKEARAWVA